MKESQADLQRQLQASKKVTTCLCVYKQLLSVLTIWGYATIVFVLKFHRKHVTCRRSLRVTRKRWARRPTPSNCWRLTRRWLKRKYACTLQRTHTHIWRHNMLVSVIISLYFCTVRELAARFEILWRANRGVVTGAADHQGRAVAHLGRRWRHLVPSATTRGEERPTERSDCQVSSWRHIEFKLS